MFRYNNANLVSAFLGIDQTTEVLERNTPNTLSTVTNTLNNVFQLFPNPAENYISILTNNNETLKHIKIINVAGQEVLKVNKNTTSLSIADLPNGLYFISIETESGKTSTKKLVKK